MTFDQGVFDEMSRIARQWEAFGVALAALIEKGPEIGARVSAHAKARSDLQLSMRDRQIARRELSLALDAKNALRDAARDAWGEVQGLRRSTISPWTIAAAGFKRVPAAVKRKTSLPVPGASLDLLDHAEAWGRPGSRGLVCVTAHIYTPNMDASQCVAVLRAWGFMVRISPREEMRSWYYPEGAHFVEVWVPGERPLARPTARELAAMISRHSTAPGEGTA